MSQNLELNDDFVKAFELMDKTTINLFVTGRAGTGKSTLLTYFREKTKKNVVVLAPTGVAAINVGGQTIHSFFGFKPDITLEKVRTKYRNKDKKGLYRNLDTIVIDEISMVRADLLDCVDEFMRLNGPESSMPFGGVQMIMIGDLYQLPPVVTREEKAIYAPDYQSLYFFDARVMADFEYSLIELNKIYRQSDPEFIEILNAVRNKSINEGLLAKLNSRHQEDYEPEAETLEVYLTTTNAKAQSINEARLSLIKGESYFFSAKIEGEFEKKSFPASENLELKVGAQIMLTNNDREGRWVNGTMGKVSEIVVREIGPIVEVELASGDMVEVRSNTWEMYRFSLNQKNQRVEAETVGTYTQLPMILAWSVTIHKSQGKTFERVIIDMDRGAFAHGQTYVALSRATSLEGIVLKKPITRSHILLDSRVVKFMTGDQDKETLVREAILGHKAIKIVYLKENEEKTERVIWPENMGSIEYQGQKYIGLSGFDELRGEPRTFRVDRILSIDKV